MNLLTFDLQAMTLKNGGNVLVPCCTVGALYDLIECLHKHLESAGLGATPLYCLSPVANSSLAYSCIYSEWSVGEVVFGMVIMMMMMVIMMMTTMMMMIGVMMMMMFSGSQ